MIDSASVTSVVFFGDATDSWLGRWRPIVTRFTFVPYISAVRLSKQEWPYYSDEHEITERARIIGGSAGCVCRALRRLRSEREANEAFRSGGGAGVRKRICKTVWPKSMRGNERKGFRTHKGELYMRVICLVCMAGTRAPLKSSVSIIIKREATNYVSSLGS